MASLGIIETRGYSAAIAAVDAALKAANVVFIGYRQTSPALISVQFSGDVASVQAAVSAGTSAARAVGQVVGQLILARPDGQLEALLRTTSPPSANNRNGTDQWPQPGPAPVREPPPQGAKSTQAPDIGPVATKPAKVVQTPASQPSTPATPARKKRAPVHKKRTTTRSARPAPKKTRAAAGGTKKTAARTKDKTPQPKPAATEATPQPAPSGGDPSPTKQD